MPTLEWIGKDKVINHHQNVPFRVLERQYSYDENGQRTEDNGSENMIIRGDNLEALKSLLPRYEGKVKCIYIDPPYNTGNEGWVYNDNVNDHKIRKWLGEVVGKEGEDLSRHDKWLCMMYPRLKLLQKLLADDGVIFISIDDTEIANLKLICNEIFGANNHIATFVWQKRYSPDARTAISDAHEFILCFAKNPEAFKTTRHLLPLTNAQTKQFSNPDKDPRGPWKADNFTAPGYRPNQMYEITLPSGRIVTPPKGRCWRVTKEGFDRFVSEGKMIYGNNGDGAPAVKRFLSEMPGMVPWTWWNHEEVGHSQEGNKQLAAILGKAVFDYPKPVRLIERILQIASDPDSIILDSFAGSGTTAHAVLNMNKADGGNRKFILVEMMDYADSITAERVKRVIDGYGSGKNAVEGTGGSFSFYDLGEPLMIGENLNEAVPVEKIREYIWYMETKQPYVPGQEHPYLLGTHNSTDYYFYYEPERLTVLDFAFLATIQEKADGTVIYADRCAINEERLATMGIVFKKIPRDIAKL
jgi:adenine-specific DNA-methyltransferase